MNTNSAIDPPEYIEQAVEEAQLLVSYISRHSPVQIDTEQIEVLINSNHKIKTQNWTPQDEIKFWNAYDQIATSIEPVTIESLKATMPDPFDKEKKKTDAAKSVFKYRILTAIALMLLVFTQSYWINGSDLTQKLNALFYKIDETGFEIEKRKDVKNYENIERDIEISKLEDNKKKLIQEFGATYTLLAEWNRIWQVLSFKEQYKAQVTDYIEKKHKDTIADIQKEIKEISALDIYSEYDKREKIKELKAAERKENFSYEFDKERNKLFLTRISAEFIIRSLQIYVLPLIYGLLGALIFTLRSLSKEIKNLTYTSHSETKYRLRISMGLLGGMAIGWFFKPEDVAEASSLSPMAISFLVGYNVELLFNLMDKLIATISDLEG